MCRIRLDLAVAEQKSVSREYAKELIASGKVMCAGRMLTKPGIKIPEETRLCIDAPDGMPYVGRGGLKLEKALSAFHISVAGKICCDVGASTGGFTECLLRHGAVRVFAIDCGVDQLSPKLRTDPRVVSMEQTNIRDLERLPHDALCDLAVVDVSFISLEKVIPHILPLLSDESFLVCLVKPQFEAGRAHLSNKGIVRDAGVREAVIQRVSIYAESLGLTRLGLIESPIKGGDGNTEYFLHLSQSL